MEAPVLQTERLILRAHRVDDFPNCARMWADPLVTRFIGGKPQTSEDAWNRLLRYSGLWSLLGFGYWAVEDKASGAFLGETGFANYRRLMDPPLGDIPEAGWVFLPEAHGKGIAREAVQAIHEWGGTHFASWESACIIHPENEASLRLAERCGYRETLRAIYREGPTVQLHRSWR